MADNTPIEWTADRLLDGREWNDMPETMK